MTEDQDADARIDEALRSRFAPPDLSELVRCVQDEPARCPRSPWHRLAPWLLAAAAAVVIAIGILARSEKTVADTDGDGDALVAQWVAAYRDAVAQGFDSPSCCIAASDLASRCREAFAAAVELAAGTEVRVCGAFCGKPAGGAVTMMARSDDRPVCLFVMPSASAPRFQRRAFGDVVVHRRELGALAVFEVSHEREPHLLARVCVPER